MAFPQGFSLLLANFVGPKITDEIKNFFMTSRFPPRMNETHVRLIPKGIGPKKVANYRPIALCNVYYKIVAKILTKRMHFVLPSIISENQSAFVPGRAITDNVLISHAVLHFLRTSKATKWRAMAVKTDMSKAYDRIEWCFLKAVLEKMGFHSVWIGWILECVTTVSYSFLINGTPQGKVMPTRGLRQGDPLSPCLFILCTKVLSGLCQKAQMDGSLPGVRVARQNPPVSLFIDDTMFFCRSDSVSCQALAAILTKYEAMSGQSINLTKSSITLSSKTPQSQRSRAIRQLHIRNEGGTGKYLGILENFGRKKRDIFAELVDKIRQRSHSWSSRFLSPARKETLLNSVLSAMPSYSMSCFKLPTSLCKQIQSILCRFWWDSKPGVRKMSWIAWSKLTIPKNAGGLSFREIEAFNDSLLAKIGWRIIRYPTTLLARVLLGKYCHNSSSWSVKVHRTPPMVGGVFSPIVKCWHKGLDGGLVTGKSSSYGLIVALHRPSGNSPWSTTCQRRHIEGERVNRYVCKLLELDKNTKHNSRPWRKNQTFPLSSSRRPDALIWLPSKKGEYSSKSGYALLTLPEAPPCHTNFNWQSNVWRLKTTPKMKHLVWKAAVGALPVSEQLHRRGIQIDQACKRCGAGETVLLVFRDCVLLGKSGRHLLLLMT